MSKHIKYNHKQFLSTLEKGRGKPLGPGEIQYVPVQRGNGVAMIIDGVLYDCESCSTKEEDNI